MNQGLDAATGEYIAILESDDAFTPDALEVLYNLATTHNAQAVKADFWFYWSQNEKLEPCHVISEGLCDKLVSPPQKEFESFYAKPSIWSGMYNRAFLKETIFASWKRRSIRATRTAHRQGRPSTGASQRMPRVAGQAQQRTPTPARCAPALRPTSAAAPPLPWSFSIAAQPEYSPAGGKAASFAAGARSAERVRQRCFGHSRANCQHTAEGARKALNQRFHLPGSQAPGQQP